LQKEKNKSLLSKKSRKKMIKTDISKYIIRAYLKVYEKCDFIDYNTRPPDAVLRVG